MAKGLTQYRIFSDLGQSVASRGKTGWLRVSSLWVYRVLTWSVLAAALAFAASVLALRYWILPGVDGYRERIARFVSERMQQKVTIGRIEANWDGLRPRLRLEQVTVHDRAGRPALHLPRVDQTLSWLSLPALELRYHAIDIHGPVLEVRRDREGRLAVAGIELAGAEEGGGFADWLLRQRDIEIRDATLVWHDEKRDAPPLELRSVHLQLFSRGARHRFGLRALPPEALAGALDVRGSFTGDSVRALEQWRGRLFVQLDYADLGAARAWVPYPIELARGAGAVRAWLAFGEGRLTEALADVRLASVRARLARDLPELDLAELNGRIGWKSTRSGFELRTVRLGLATAGGLALHPADFLLRLETEGGELRADALELAPLVALADHLPLERELRERLAAFAPRGTVFEVAARWKGDWREPGRYSAKGRFRDLALAPAGTFPGFRGLSGALEANERGGTLQLASQKVVLELPRVFKEAIELDTLAAQVAWTRAGAETEFRLNNVSFANAHAAGTAFGTYRAVPGTLGYVDLTGHLTRADARHVARYVPLVVQQATREWLERALLAGHSNEVSLRMKGRLDEFPFGEDGRNLFQVAAKVSGGTLDYAPGWPRIEHIAGDLLFRGRRMSVLAREGTISGVRLARVSAEIPDLVVNYEWLRVSGEAEGPTAQFLAFIERSPVSGMIDRFTEGWRAEGAGRLALRFEMPLREIGKTKIHGSFRFAGNTLRTDPALPPVEQASGRVEFTESSVRVEGAKGVILGGPATLSAATAEGGTVKVNVQGRVNVEEARRAAARTFWTERLRGATDWSARFVLRKGASEFVFESDLQGLAVGLPAPLVKTAGEKRPLRVERRASGDGGERLGFSFGEVVSARLERTSAQGRAVIARGTVRFGGPAPEPGRPGVWVSGKTDALDLDRWLAFARASEETPEIVWGGVELGAGTLDAFGRRVSDFEIRATVEDGRWRGRLSAQGSEGVFEWHPQGRGRLVARLKRLAWPQAAPEPAERAQSEASKERELPALDIVAEQFVRKGRALGRLELAATPESGAWRIERLRLANDDGTFRLEGRWRPGADSRTQASVRVETSDVGKFLARLGYSEGVRGGTAKLEGALSWAGAPYELDFSTLSGNLVLDAAKGQFLKVEPGVAKLLGILSLQALPRRIALDFRDIFSEGFAFDQIVGAVRIRDGIASVENFTMQGPSARVAMSGEVNLVEETQRLRVRVTPFLSDSVSIAGALIGGPVAGVAAFLAQKVLKDPLDRLASYEYDVSGTWAEPRVERVPRAAPAPGSGEAPR